ncbi:hypothetical protein [Micromonospora sp. NPDC007230]|uniref:hypothetical protein n=1 Tax=Micromonospora sp. NPDC007230 TaxID=3364237 RepID=UPI0036993D48
MAILEVNSATTPVDDLDARHRQRGARRRLLAADLVDELRLMVDPVRLGGGKRIWPSDGTSQSYALTRCTPTSTGSLLLHCERAAGGQD